MNRINTRQVQWGIKFHMQGQLDFKSSKLVNLLYIWVSNTWGFPSDSELKNLPAKEEMQETGFDPWVRKIPWRRKWQPIPVILPGKSHEQRTLVGYSPWSCKESDTTEQLSASTGTGYLFCTWAFLVTQVVANPPAMQETPVPFLGQQDPLEKGQATHLSFLGLPWWLSW